MHSPPIHPTYKFSIYASLHRYSLVESCQDTAQSAVKVGLVD